MNINLIDFKEKLFFKTYATKEYFKLVSLIVVLMLIFFCNFSMFARFGGGHSFSGGSSVGGHSYSSSNSYSDTYSSDNSSDSEEMLEAFPIVVFFLAISLIGGVLFVIGSKGKQDAEYHLKEKRALSDKRFAEELRLFKEKYPVFSETAFIQRFKKVFTKLQNAWSNQNMDEIRCFVSDGVYERFSLLLEINKNSYIKNVVEKLKILDAKIVKIESGNHFDTVHVMVKAAMYDYYVNTNKGGWRMVNGTSDEPFVEYWSFLRKHGVDNVADSGLLEGNCPNCGAPIEIIDCNTCKFCKAVINSGEYDWVLAEITQETVWNGNLSGNIPGLDKIQKKDSGFNIQHIEDRVSVMFYRNVASQFFANPKYMSKLATNHFLDKNSRSYKPGYMGEHIYYSDAAIGSVEVLEIIPAEDRDLPDRIKVEVVWSGTRRYVKKVPSFIAPDFDNSEINTSIFTLIRKQDALSSVEKSLTSLHCPNCGSPEKIDNNGECTYCGLVLNDGKCDWVLDKII